MDMDESSVDKTEKSTKDEESVCNTSNLSIESQEEGTGNSSGNSTANSSWSMDSEEIDRPILFPNPEDHNKFLNLKNEEEKSTEDPSTSTKVAKAAEPSTSGQKLAEMNSYINKLRHMVPYARNSPKLSKVQLIHSTIDYITDLQESLEARVKTESSSNRAPLANLSTTGHQPNSLNISPASSQQRIQEVPPRVTATPITSPIQPRPSSGEPSEAHSSKADSKIKEKRTTIDVINEYFIRKVAEGDIFITETNVNLKQADNESSSSSNSSNTKEAELDASSSRSHENLKRKCTKSIDDASSSCNSESNSEQKVLKKLNKDK